MYIDDSEPTTFEHEHARFVLLLGSTLLASGLASQTPRNSWLLIINCVVFMIQGGSLRTLHGDVYSR